jgi:hypothetical protein
MVSREYATIIVCLFCKQCIFLIFILSYQLTYAIWHLFPPITAFVWLNDRKQRTPFTDLAHTYPLAILTYYQ